ncbi:tetratricopeptide TPR_2 [Candidatus Vecturithrix granuli]|uniref:Tetratricopeptide TPR_2 n=1 Tax=Vecturithrix granuli TaxID=1499967 RepID=A0A081BYZ3_VECG1|nr:tetratricopeptide TPR_2 [Candidatus Vecturithrix granuli]
MTDKTYDVFLSYNSEDHEAVEKIAIYLHDQAGLHVWFDIWEIIPGVFTMDQLEQGLSSSTTCAVFVGKTGEGPWQKREVETALRQQIHHSEFRVIPVLLLDAPRVPELPMFLAENMWVDFRGKGLNDDVALWRLECGIRGMAPGRGRPIENQIENLVYLGKIYQTTGSVKEAILLYEKALELARNKGDRRIEGAILGNLGDAYAKLEELSRAIEYYEQGLNIARNVGDKENEALWLNNLGNAYKKLEETAQAIECFTLSLAIVRERGSKDFERFILANLGYTYYLSGNISQALAAYNQALDVAQEIGDKWGEQDILGQIGLLYQEIKNFSQAIKYYTPALNLAQKISAKHSIASLLFGIGYNYALQQKNDQALDHYQKALHFYEDVDDTEDKAAAMMTMGHFFVVAQEDFETARTYMKNAVKILQRLNSPRAKAYQEILAKVSYPLGIRYVEQGRWYDGLKLLEEILNIYRQNNDLQARVDILYQIARTHQLMGNFDKANLYYRDAQHLEIEASDKNLPE